MLPGQTRTFFLMLIVCLCLAAPGFAFVDDWMDSSAGDPEAEKKQQQTPVWVVIENQAVIDAPVAAVAEFLKDVQKSIAITPGLRNKVVLKDISSTERIDFDHYKLAWPFKDRYLIYHARQEYDRGDEILLTLDSIDDYPYDGGGKIRGTIRKSHFLLKALQDDPSRTLVEVRMRVNPGGWLPTWFLNTQTKNWSDKLLNNLQKKIQKEPARETRLRPAKAQPR